MTLQVILPQEIAQQIKQEAESKGLSQSSLARMIIIANYKNQNICEKEGC